MVTTTEQLLMGFLHGPDPNVEEMAIGFGCVVVSKKMSESQTKAGNQENF